METAIQGCGAARRIFFPFIFVSFILFVVQWRMNTDEILETTYPSRATKQEPNKSQQSADVRENLAICLEPIWSGSRDLEINTTIPTSDELERLFPHIQLGGHWQPEHCKQKQKLGIFVPMRNRWHQLPIFLRHLHTLLVRKWRNYTIYVIEQTDGSPFNRAKLLNVGVTEALKTDPDLNCFILHDVDTLPETTYTNYVCHDDPRLVVQMAPFQKKRNYEIAYKGYTGGVLAIRRSQFEDINGFSNEFWGWGGEDDDLNNRLEGKSYKVAPDLSRGGYFYSLDHPLVIANPKREEIVDLHKRTNLYREGLNTVGEYSVLTRERKLLFTQFSVDISKPDGRPSS